MLRRPRRRLRIHTAVPEQHLGDAVASVHQVASTGVVAAGQLARSLDLRWRNDDPRQRPGQQQTGEQLGVLAIGLDPIPSVRNEKGHLGPMHLDKAGAQVAAASNMATLAVTAALSQQLEAISEQLQEMSETLEGMVKDKDRERLSDALAANEILFEIAESVRRRGITQADYTQLAGLKHRVTSLKIETTAKLAEIAPNGVPKLGRNKRLELLESLYAKERLEYWLALQIQADLARTRCDLLTLLWEHRSHPETAAALNQNVANAIRSRQLRAAEVGDALRALSDPTSQTRLDPVRVISRHQLGKAQARIDDLLLTHGAAFAGPDCDPHTVSQAVLEPTSTSAPATALPISGSDPKAP